MVKKYNLFLLENNQYSEEYVIGLPSGEVIYTEKETNKKLVDDDIVYYKHLVNGEIINCYCFDDKNRDKIIDYIDKDKFKKYFDVGVPTEMLKICKMFQEETFRIINKRVAIGYIRSYGYNYFYAVVPDININKNFYEIRKEPMNELLKRLEKENYGSYFYFKERVSGAPLQYYI